uniref:Thioredoxin domain-containing protein 3 n=2 Tax=Cacopsylla melanoneura TaxID=428564 RepID=A0A8D8Y3A9_9HEMI
MQGYRGRMAKKGGPVQLQAEINTNEDWQKMLTEKKGLVVVEVYSGWCGPCVAISGNLKKMKLDNQSEFFHLAMAKSDEIEELKRFRNKSEPVWMIIGNGKLVTVMFGTNAPKIIKVVEKEFQEELKVMKGELERPEKSFTTMTPEEEMKLKRDENARKDIEMKEAAELLERSNKYRMRSLDRVSKLLTLRSLLLIFPNAKLPTGECPVLVELLTQLESILCTVLWQDEELQLTEHNLHKVFFKSDFKLSDTLKELILKEPCIAVVVQFDPAKFRPEGEEPPEGEVPVVSLPLGDIEYKLANKVYGLQDDETIDCNKPRDDSISGSFMTTLEDDSLMPSIWTPVKVIQKSAAMDALYPDKLLEEFKYTEDKMPPQQVIMVFEAINGGDIEEVIVENKSIVYRHGYFDSANPELAKLVAKTFESLKKFPDDKIKATKLVIGVTEWADDTLLKFTSSYPLYISPDPKLGSKEAEMFFPYNYNELKEEKPVAPVVQNAAVDSTSNEEEDELEAGEQEEEGEGEEEENKEEV